MASCSGIYPSSVVALNEELLQNDRQDLADIWESAIPDDINVPLQANRLGKHNSRIEVTNGRGFVWRSGSGDSRTSLYGGTVGYLKQIEPKRHKQYERRHNQNKRTKEKASNPSASG